MFPPNREFKKFKPVCSIFTDHNGRFITSKISVTTKRSIDKLDIQDAYFSVPHPLKTQKYVRFQWEVKKKAIKKKTVPISLFLCWTSPGNLHETSKDFYVNSKENEHSIENLFRQHCNIREEPGGNLNETRHFFWGGRTVRGGVGSEFCGYDYVPPRSKNN